MTKINPKPFYRHEQRTIENTMVHDKLKNLVKFRGFYIRKFFLSKLASFLSQLGTIFNHNKLFYGLMFLWLDVFRSLSASENILVKS